MVSPALPSPGQLERVKMLSFFLDELGWRTPDKKVTELNPFLPTEPSEVP